VLKLPIESVLPQLRDTLVKSNNVVLQAPPGAGKTTRVPLALLDASWLGNKKIVMLEPRRLAVRAAARFMAQSLGEKVGETVGYRVRLDSQVSSATRIEVVTEGILTRMLQNDPSLEKVAAILFDEFHERSLHADLGLALCLDTQSVFREDLRLVVMSATLDGASVAHLLGDAPILTSEGRRYPVEIHYRPTRSQHDRERLTFCDEVAATVQHALREETGSILVFLPGAGEIRHVQMALERANLGVDVLLAPLFGQLNTITQDLAIQPAPEGKRKIVLATAIAETSLTIDGIRVVIDAGLMRLQGFNPNTGLTQLVTLPVSVAAATQRCGRAGRLQPGVCYRLWPERKHLQDYTPPEIREADLTTFVLELAQWGVRDVSQLRWLDNPPIAHYSQAVALLQKLGALDEAARITAHGNAMIELGVHPRLGHMMLRGNELGYGALACELAGLLGERDPLRGTQGCGADIALRVEVLRNGGGFHHIDRRWLKQVRETVKQWRRQLRCAVPPEDNADLTLIGVLLAYAYPDRIGQRRDRVHNRFVLSNGRGAFISDADPLVASDFIVAANLDDGREARIHLAATIHHEQLRHFHSSLISEHRFVSWDERASCVQARCQQRLGEWVLLDKPWQDADPEAMMLALLEGIRHKGPAYLPWTDAARQLQARMNFLHHFSPPDWPDVSDTTLISTLEDWLLPFLHGMTRLAHLSKLDLKAILLGLLPWAQRKQLDELAPTHLTVPSGSHLRLDYSQHTPVLSVRLQEMFGLSATPCIAGGSIPILLHLLSPARRPVQITQDLAVFWKGSYHDVKKELKGRYPKHHWPDDPLQAIPTTRVKRKSKK